MIAAFGSVREACDWLAPDHDLDTRAIYRAVERATTHIPRMRDALSKPTG